MNLRENATNFVSGELNATVQKGSKLLYAKNALPWVEKYRPWTMEEIISHEDILKALSRLISLRRLPHLLFYGPTGSGKTTTALACARKIYASGSLKGNVLELNASDERGIDVVRYQIKDFSSTSQVFSRTSFKLVILDEADQMTSEAQAALRRVMEKYTCNVRFIILCNHVNKIISAIQSRCTRFRFGPLHRAQMFPRLTELLGKENVKYDEEGITAAIQVSGGDMRCCINILQGIALSYNEIRENYVYRCTGTTSSSTFQSVIKELLLKDFREAHQRLQQMVTNYGLSMLDIVRGFYSVLLRLELSDDVKAFLLEQLATHEHRLSQGGGEKINMASLVAIFQLAKEGSTQKTPVSIKI